MNEDSFAACDNGRRIPITDDYMFGYAMRQPGICKGMIKCLLPEVPVAEVGAMPTAVPARTVAVRAAILRRRPSWQKDRMVAQVAVVRSILTGTMSDSPAAREMKARAMAAPLRTLP